MTQLLKVTRNDDGQYEIVNGAGKLVDGPFETNAAAWKALDRLDNDNANRPDKQRSNKKVLWGKPDKTSKKQRGKERHKQSPKMTAKQEHRMKVNASKAVGWVRAVAAVKFEPEANRAYRDQKLGTFGAASEVRKIDPAQYLAEKAARGER